MQNVYTNQKDKMKPTLLEMPVLGPMIRGFARVFLMLLGWKTERGQVVDKCVAIAAPHTSNWDFVFAIAVCYAMNINIRWMGKHTLFRWPFGALMRRLGGLPVDRSRGFAAAKQALQAFQAREQLILVIPPEATRGKAPGWKGGFYLIARMAKVPIALGYVDYQRRVGGFGPLVHPSNDTDADMAAIATFYAGVSAKYPENVSEVVLLAKDQ